VQQLFHELDVLSMDNLVTGRFGRLLAGVVSVLALAGALSACGGGGGSDGPPLSKAAAANRYLELVVPINEGMTLQRSVGR